MTRRPTIPEPWKALADKLGGIAQLAETLATTPGTVFKWSRGQAEPRGTAKLAIAQLFKRHHLQGPF